MNVLLRLVLSCALLFAGFAPAVAQQNVPNGSYVQSCTNIRVIGPRLIASCTAPNGARVQSEVAYPSCGGRDIGNVNGYLRCSGPISGPGPGYGPGPGGPPPGGPGPGGPGYGPRPLPPGSYQASCNGAHIRDGRLIAICTAANGMHIRSSMPLGSCRRGDIANNNGRLQCNY